MIHTLLAIFEICQNCRCVHPSREASKKFYKKLTFYSVTKPTVDDQSKKVSRVRMVIAGKWRWWGFCFEPRGARNFPFLEGGGFGGV